MDSSSTFIDLGATINESVIVTIIGSFVRSKCFYLIAPTGTGKSTILPAALASARSSEPSRVICSIPTRIAVDALYNEMTSRNEKTSKISIGFASDSNIVYNENTSLAYVTTDHLLLRFMSYYKLASREGRVRKNSFGVEIPKETVRPFCDFIVLDEVHLGTMSNSIIMQIWQDLNSRGLPVPRLLLMSANDVNVPITGMIKGRISSSTLHPIKTVHQGNEKSYNFSSRPYELYGDAGRIAAGYFVNPEVEGHVLVFGPGKAELDSIERAFNEEIERLKYSGRINRFTIQSSEDEKDQQKADEAVGESGGRKIIFSTNAAETSITINNLQVIVDTLTEKNLYCSEDESPILRTEWISKDSVLQRRGRIGRTRSGIYHMMCNEAFERLMNPHRPLEVERIPLSQTILRLIRKDLNPYFILSASPKVRIDDAYQLAENIGALDRRKNGDPIVTERGKFCASMPISTRSASFLFDVIQGYKGKRDSNYYFPILIASIIENFDSQFFRYTGVDTRNKKAKLAFWEQHFAQYVGESSLETYLRIFFAIINKVSSRANPTQEDLERHFAKESQKMYLKKYVAVGIVRTYLRIVKSLRLRRIEGNFSMSHFDINSSVSSIISNLSGQLKSSFPIYTRSFENGNRYFRQQDAVEQYRVSGNGWYDTMNDNFHEHLLAFSTITITGSGESKKISLCCRIDDDRLLVTRNDVKRAIEQRGQEPISDLFFPKAEEVDIGQLSFSEIADMMIGGSSSSNVVTGGSSSSNESQEDIVARQRREQSKREGKFVKPEKQIKRGREQPKMKGKFVKPEKQIKKVGVQFVNYVASLDLAPLPDEFKNYTVNYGIKVLAEAKGTTVVLGANDGTNTTNYTIKYDDVNPYRYLPVVGKHYQRDISYPVDFFAKLIRENRFLVVLYGNPIQMPRIRGLFFTSDSTGYDHYLASLGTIEQLPNERMVYYYQAPTVDGDMRKTRTNKVIELMRKSKSLVISAYNFSHLAPLEKTETFNDKVYYHHRFASVAPVEEQEGQKKSKKQEKSKKQTFVLPVVSGEQ